MLFTMYPTTAGPHQDPGKELHHAHRQHTFQQWHRSHYARRLGCKKGGKLTPEEEEI